MIKKKRLKEFLLHEEDVIPVMIPHGDWVVHGSSQRMKTTRGTIIFVQSESQDSEFGLIPGFVASKEYKPRGCGRGVMAIKVRPLTPKEQKKYRPRLRRRLRGPLNFW